MAHYKHIDTSPRFLAVDLEAQLLPGSFEHALNHLIDHEIDLGAFDARFNNDEVGASAYPPAMLLKVVLLAYRRTKQMCPFAFARGKSVPARIQRPQLSTKVNVEPPRDASS